MASRAVFKSRLQGLDDATHILLRGLPTAVTANDVRRLTHGIKGITKVDLRYKHFRQTGAAVLTMSLPDYTKDAIVECRRLPLRGYATDAEPLVDPTPPPSGHEKTIQHFNRYIQTAGDGPSAGVVPRKTVTLSGFHGKIHQDAILKLCANFKLRRPKDAASIQRVILPDRKFSMFARFCVHLESESEAQRLVRHLHMTPYKGIEGAPIIRAEVIY